MAYMVLYCQGDGCNRRIGVSEPLKVVDDKALGLCCARKYPEQTASSTTESVASDSPHPDTILARMHKTLIDERGWQEFQDSAPCPIDWAASGLTGCKMNLHHFHIWNKTATHSAIVEITPTPPRQSVGDYARLWYKAELNGDPLVKLPNSIQLPGRWTQNFSAVLAALQGRNLIK